MHYYIYINLLHVTQGFYLLFNSYYSYSRYFGIEYSYTLDVFIKTT